MVVLTKIAHVVSALLGVILVVSIVFFSRYERVTLSIFILMLSATLIIDNYNYEHKK